MKKIIRDLETFQYFYPYTVALVGARAEGRTNFMSCAWHTALSFRPPLFGVLISKKRFSHGLISEAGEFTVNFIAADKALLSARYGRKSGGDMDKLEEYPLRLAPPSVVQTPVIDDAYVCLECRLAEVRTYGDHDLFVGEVLAVHQEEGSFDEEGVLDPGNTRPLCYLGSDVYITVDPASKGRVLPE